MLLLGAPGCASEAASGIDGCQHASACDEGFKCDAGFCVAEGENSLRVHARILPLNDSGLLEQHVPEIDLSAGTKRTVQLLSPISVQGWVYREDAPGINVPGKLDARTLGDIPGIDYRSTAPSFDGIGNDFFGFNIQLLPGRDYEVTFRPDQTDLAPHQELWTADEIQAGTRTIELPPTSQYMHVMGQLQFENGDAIAMASISGVLPSGVATASTQTDAYGSFALTVPPHAEDIRFQVKPTSESILFPDHLSEVHHVSQVSYASLDVDSAEAPSMVVTLPNLAPGIAPVQTHLRILTADASGDISPLPYTDVTIVGTFEGGTIKMTQATDKGGEATFSTLPGGYECYVDTEPDSPWASWLALLNITQHTGDEETTQDIHLNLRPHLKGMITKHDGTTLTAGIVEATRAASSGIAGTIWLPSATFTAEIGEDGRYEIPVDPGKYDIQVMPDVVTGAPPLCIPEVEVGTEVSTTALDVQLPGTSMLTLQLVRADADRAAVTDAVIEIYAVETNDIPANTSTRPALLTSATTDSAGAVEILVPYLP